MQPSAFQGTLDLRVLKTLSLEPMHGWGITQRIRDLSEGLLDVNLPNERLAKQWVELPGLPTWALPLCARGEKGGWERVRPGRRPASGPFRRPRSP